MALTAADVWRGGFYALAIELGTRSDARLESALLALWHNARLEGCYLRRDFEPADQQHIEPSLELLERYGHLFCARHTPRKLTAVEADVMFSSDDESALLSFQAGKKALFFCHDGGVWKCEQE